MTGIWALLSLPACASPNANPLITVLAFSTGGLLGLIWLVQVLRVVLDADGRQRMTRRAAIAWSIYPATGLLLLFLLMTGLFFEVRVRLSETALERLAAEVTSGAEVKGTRWVGLVRIEGARMSGNAVLFSTESKFLAEYGLAYSRDGAPPALPGRPVVSHVFGRWYTFTYYS